MKNCSAKIWDAETIIISLGATIGNVGIAKNPTATKQGLSGIVVNRTQILPKYLFYILFACKGQIQAMATGATIKEVRPTALINNLNIPLPPLEEQQSIVDELDSYQKGIDGAKQVIDSLKPKIKIDEDWEVKKIGDIFDTQYGISKSIPQNLDSNGIKIISTADIGKNGNLNFTGIRKIKKEEGYEKFTSSNNTLLFNWRNAPDHIGKTALFDNVKSESFIFASFLIAMTNKNNDTVDNKYIWYLLNQMRRDGIFKEKCRKVVNQANFNAEELKGIQIPLPPIHIQQEIVEQLEAERKIIEFQKNIIAILEKKIQNRLDELWQSERKNKVSDKQNEPVSNQLAFESLINKTSKPSQ